MERVGLDVNRISGREVIGFVPKLVIVRGLPGSGKTFLSHKLKDVIQRESTSVLDPDEINRETYEYVEFTARLRSDNAMLDPKFFPFRYLIEMASNSLNQGGIVIWNQPFSDLEGLAITFERLGRNVDRPFEILIIDLEISPELARKRIEERIKNGGHGPDRKKFDDFVAGFQRADCMGHNHMVVESEAILERDVENILKKLGVYG